MTHRPVPPPPPGPTPEPGYPEHSAPPPPPPTGALHGYAPGTYYAPGWSPAQMAGPPPPLARRRRGLWAAVIAAGLVLVALIVWLALTPTVWFSLTGATKALPGDVDAPQQANVRQLTTGNCIEDVELLRAESTRVEVVPCSQEHTAQVISTFVFSDPDWAGSDQTQSRVARSCSLSTAEIEAGHTLLALSPSERSWSQGDRSGFCVAVSPAPVSTSLL